MEKNKFKSDLLRTTKLLTYILVYYALCITLSFITKYFISEQGYNFRFPIFKSAITNMCHFLGALAILIYRGENRKYEQPQQTLACAVIGSVDIGIGIHILRQVDLAFYTIIKSATPVFILLSGFVLGTEKVSFFTLLSILLIAFGTYLVTVKPIPTNNMDIYLLVGSAIVSGFRWSFIQFILSKKKSNVYIAIRDLCLPTSLLLFVYAFKVYGVREILESSFFDTYRHTLVTMTIISILGFASLAVLVCELVIVKKTSVLFLSISAVIKELIIVGVSITRGDTCMTKLNYLGIVISILGILLYNGVKYKKI